MVGYKNDGRSGLSNSRLPLVCCRGRGLGVVANGSGRSLRGINLEAETVSYRSKQAIECDPTTCANCQA